MSVQNYTIQITVFTPGKTVRKILVNQFSKIGYLSHLFENKKVSFIYKGQMLCNDMTFNFYKIKNNDSLVCVFQTEKKIEHWQNLSKRNDFNKIASMEAAQEYTKTLDLRLNKMDYHPRKYRNFCKRFMNNLENKKTTPIKHDTVIPLSEDIQAPSSEPLPIFWKQSNTVVKEVSLQNSISQLVESDNNSSSIQNVLMKD